MRGSGKPFLKTVPLSPIFFIIPILTARLFVLFRNYLPHDSAHVFFYVFRGFFSDLAAGLFIGFAACIFYKAGRLYAAFWVFWALIASSNAAHIQVNDSNLNFIHWERALTKGFLAGSVLSLPILLGFILCLAVSGAIVCWMFLKDYVRYFTTKRLLPALILCFGIAFVPRSGAVPNWVQMNVVEENLVPLFRQPFAHWPDFQQKRRVLRMFFYRDRDGKPIMDYPSAPHNAMFIFLEGLSRDMVSENRMPYLSRLAKEHISYDNFVSLQRQSNRGLYASLCGDYPNYLGHEAKADILVSGMMARQCLPSVLANHGFNTLFMQSTDPGFLQIDKFSAKAGFQRTLGDGDFPNAYYRNGWGVDDRTLFQQAIRQMEGLSQNRKPWFITLFTAGTHHPYMVPGVAMPSMEQALRYLDDSLAEFFQKAAEKGFMQNTLFLISSDESDHWGDSGLEGELSENHAPLIVISPQAHAPLKNDGLFTQMDLMLSLCDYFGLDTNGMAGRSIFRFYETGRNIVFGNIYTSLLYGYYAQGVLYRYSKIADEWRAYRLDPGRLFDSKKSAVNPDPQEVDALKALFRHNERKFDKSRPVVLYSLENASYDGARRIIGDHKISCEPDDRMIWKAVIESREPLVIRFRLHYYDGRFHRIREPDDEWFEWPSKSPFILEREYIAAEDVASVWSNLDVYPSRNAGFLIRELSIKRVPSSRK
jgi:hypothetical protein